MRRIPTDTAEERRLARLERHRYGALVEPLVEEPSFLVKSMFGCLACYLHGRLMVLLADRRPPWRGVLVLTSREHQASLRAEMPALAVHPVLGKWLILTEEHDDFEESVARVVTLALGDDPRVGVDPKPRKPRKKKS